MWVDDNDNMIDLMNQLKQIWIKDKFPPNAWSGYKKGKENSVDTESRTLWINDWNTKRKRFVKI